MSVKELSDKDKLKFYKSLVTKNYVEAASEIGLDKRYTNISSLRGAGFNLYRSIDPVALGIPQDVVDMVAAAIEERKMASRRQIAEPGEVELLDPNDTKKLVMGGRNKAAMLIHKKMDYLSKSKKSLQAENLGTLAKVFGIFFDKAQIIQGQATENIAHYAKIENNLSPEESLNILLKMREIEQERDES